MAVFRFPNAKAEALLASQPDFSQIRSKLNFVKWAPMPISEPIRVPLPNPISLKPIADEAVRSAKPDARPKVIRQNPYVCRRFGKR